MGESIYTFKLQNCHVGDLYIHGNKTVAPHSSEDTKVSCPQSDSLNPLRKGKGVAFSQSVLLALMVILTFPSHTLEFCGDSRRGEK